MRGLRIIILLNICVLGFIEGKAQDENFMMNPNTSLNVNPAIISSGDDFRVGVNFRNKEYVHSINAQSSYLMLSRPLYKDKKRFGGFGFSVISDKRLIHVFLAASSDILNVS